MSDAASAIVDVPPSGIVPWNRTTTSTEASTRPVGTYKEPATGYDNPSTSAVSPSSGTRSNVADVITPGSVDPTAVLIAACSVASVSNALCPPVATVVRVAVALPGTA